MIIRSCWSPWMFYDNTRQGSHAVAAYCLVMNILAIVFVIYQMAGGESSQFYLPLFESNNGGYSNSTLGWGLGLILYFVIFASLTLMMSSGVKRELRFMLLPWIIYNFLFVLLMLVFGGWLVYTYYSLLYSVMALVILYLFAALHFYCHLCVYSQYQLIKFNQMPIIEVYYPQL
ncbi:hypothetical protein FJT64_002301 [Amphibalanus amphitrite]|uniref:Uncharacterized protein n=1 Tax=Amphibalanus amphitrite TaxID=1232801 RepID=A0A6A4WKH8_AMPAM|nr:uncharacterized protein LOC122385881 [Amphibalanus amphitrite]XP_043230434.1 uncharacterized protein LOC122385881 [Amphibalanus amphitrite]XP_043230435.1 uncharacterized protein LOC122385881 [Amphibalanus amphitrite]XP_043230436.1 uncharacterized protein LOC122385881 [Amphibalanus amphitrite]XP_043230437.1 uncharacterized protein LOC122385881 [Amphibalanus amphitrite]XP_043230438.1 uncharacterized protein LOC122385881 [Amphibalanus amphitrite]XP_043230439.1 uncharacterized protein LOC12238